MSESLKEKIPTSYGSNKPSSVFSFDLSAVKNTSIYGMVNIKVLKTTLEFIGSFSFLLALVGEF